MSSLKLLKRFTKSRLLSRYIRVIFHKMKIVNSNINFVLESVELGEKPNSIEIKLNRNPFIPKEFQSEDYKHCKLILEGLKNSKKSRAILSEFLESFIDIEELDNNILDFWSDGIQIGEIEFKNYYEEIKEFEEKDWISEHRKLIQYFHNQSNQSTQDYIKWRKFLKNIEFNTKKEIDNLESKNEFLQVKNKQESVNSNKKVIEFANRILQMINQYKNE